jgi:mono/diheme cytochrome c family protein
MEVVALVAPFVLLGIAVLFVAFSGGPAQAREAYLTRGNRAVMVLVPLIVVGAGIAIPALVIAGRGEATGGTGKLADEDVSGKLADGKQLFKRTCSSCHTLGAVQARGVTGPNLDTIGRVTPERVKSAIRIGGTGQGRMPANLLSGEDADLVADYVSQTAGK